MPWRCVNTPGPDTEDRAPCQNRSWPVTGDQREALAASCACARQMVAMTLDSLGVDVEDDDARQVVRDHIGELEAMLDDPDGIDVALWEPEMSR